MKKILALVLALCMVLALCACGSTQAPAATAEPSAEPTEEPAAEAPAEAAEEAAAEEPAEAAETTAMTYADYAAAAIDDEVVIETYVQSKQTWWDNQVTVYTQDEDGAYFLYNMACSEEDYDKLVPGQKIRVTGYKAEWAGETEIADATFEIIDGDSYIAPAFDATALLASDELIAHQNEYVSFSGMVVESITYKNDEPGDDIYVALSKDGAKYDFCVEAYNYTTTPDSDLYAAIGELKTGDVVDLEGFLYWYYTANTHITAVTVTGNVNDKSEGTMTYADYTAAAVDDEVVIEAYVQSKQTWWEDQVTVYTQDEDGAYFLYNMACSEEDYDKLVPGQKIRVTGYKAEWAGEVEISDATFELVDDMTYIAPAKDISTDLANIESYMNQLVSISGMTVKSVEYKNGEPGDDIYVTFLMGETEYAFCVEAYNYTTTPDSELYAAVGELAEGDQVTVTGFMYWYEGPNMHITAITAEEA